MAINEAVVRHDLCTVAELLEALTEDEAWRTAHEHWVFRGQALTEWDLSPTAHRLGSDAFRPFVAEPIYEAGDAFAREVFAVVAYAKACNAAGLDLHEISSVFASNVILGDAETWGSLNLCRNEFPPPQLDRFLATARHHGLPTRFLDWSRSPIMAAFFAVQQAFKLPQKEVPEDACIAVWAADVKKIASASESEDWPSRVREIVVPTHGNLRLRAQSGLFTVVQGPSPAPLNILVQQHATSADNDMLHVFTLPWSELPVLYRRLCLMGVTAATALPDYEGALDSLVLEARATTFLKQ